MNASRSQVKQYLKKGLVTVNGEPAGSPQLHVDPEQDVICFRGERQALKKYLWLMLHKPAGYVTAREDEMHPAVLDLIDPELRKRRSLSPVGRLDIDTEGLLLITDDGKLSHYLLSPSHHVEKEYEAVFKGAVTDAMIQAFAAGMDIGDEKPAQSADLMVICRREQDTLVRIILREGRYHQIKRMAQAAGSEVLYLKRVRMGSVVLDETLPAGSWRELTAEEMEGLYEQ